jgi:glycosyltransferase involved in cell wall biosynthesis
MSKHPFSISVIIPVYNGERYLGEVIESVLAQSRPPTEILIVDDGSTDSSLAVAQRYTPQARCHSLPHGGPGAARNQGVRLAQGDYLAFVDADDLWLPDKLANQLAYLQTHPETDMVFGQVEQFISPELAPDQRPALPAQPIMAGLHVGAMLIRRRSFAAVGPFATDWTIGEFIDWYGRAQTLGLQAAVLPTVVMRRRLHSTNLTRHTHDRRGDYLKILKARLDEKRAQHQHSLRVTVR